MTTISNSASSPFDNAAALATEIVSAYVANNSVPTGELPALIATVHAAIVTLRIGPTVAITAPTQEPAVAIRKSVTNDFIVCLENGKKFKSLRRHLSSVYGMTPEQYRTKWNLPQDYPMVAPSYAAVRSQLARRIGLGTKAAVKVVAPAAKVGDVAAAKRRGRPRKAA